MYLSPDADDCFALVSMEMAFPEKAAVPELWEWERFAQAVAELLREPAAAEPAVRVSELSPSELEPAKAEPPAPSSCSRKYREAQRQA